MIKIVFLISIGVVLLACSDNDKKSFTTLDDQGNPIMTKEKMLVMDNLVTEFIACRNSSTQNLHDCKYFIAKALCEFYQIDDFKKGNSYVDYQEMHDIILGKFGTWSYVGLASNQEALEKAQEYANNSQATVAVSVKSDYGHVAIILPGSLSQAPSWKGLQVPVSASFFMTMRLEPYSGKSLAYAWSSPEDIKIFTKDPD